MKFLTILILFSFSFPSNDLINAGPMVGYSAKREVALWIQTNTQAEVKFEYWEVSNPNEIFSTSSILTDKDLPLSKRKTELSNPGFTTVLIPTS